MFCIYVADGVKLILKESVLPLESSNWIFLGAPYLTFYLALLNWLVLPLDFGIALGELLGAGILIIIAISELSIYGVIFSGWSSNSKYSFVGSLRSVSQMISYSVSLSLIILTVIFVVGSVDLLQIIFAQRSIPFVLPLLPIAFLFLISAVAETNRAPFDLPEAESELVSGFMTEYSAVAFAFFFLAEYTNILAISTLFFILFFGISIASPMVFFFVWLRASLARLRFDQLLRLGWSQILPFTVGYIIFLPMFLFTFDIISSSNMHLIISIIMSPMFFSSTILCLNLIPCGGSIFFLGCLLFLVLLFGIIKPLLSLSFLKLNFLELLCCFISN